MQVDSNPPVTQSFDDDSSSQMSVAEERDTITVTPNAATPNLSRIMNICSISKIESHSSGIMDSYFNNRNGVTASSKS